MIDSAPPAQDLQNFRPRGEEAGGSERRIAESGVRVARQHLRAWASYLPSRQFRGTIDYFLCTDSGYPNSASNRFQWESFATEGMRIIPVSGRHGGLHEEPQLSEVARTCCAILAGEDVSMLTLRSYRESINYRLIHAEDGAESIETPEGVRLPLLNQPIPGYWNVGHYRAELIDISGWAMNPEIVKPSERVLIFFRNELVLLAPVRILREDVAKYFGNRNLENSGFACEIRLTGKRRQPISAIRVVTAGVSGAYELVRIESEPRARARLFEVAASLWNLSKRLLSLRRV